MAFRASASLAAQYLRFFRALGINLKQLYGQTEASVYITAQPDGAIYADTVGSTSRGDRQWAIDALLDAAVRELSFGAAPERFPGVAEL